MQNATAIGIVFRITLRFLSSFALLLVIVAFAFNGFASNPPEMQVGTHECNPLPTPSGNIINVSDEIGLWDALNAAQPGDTILLADGIYHMGHNGYYVWLDTPNVTIRSASGNRDSVIMDDNWSGSETITVAASNVTIADLTIQRARTHPIHVVSTNSGDTLNTLIYNVRIIDPGQQAIKINPHSAKIYFPDNGEIACSNIELTALGRSKVLEINGSCYTGGVDAHAANGWVIRDNLIEGFWCGSGGLSEHGIHMWSGSQDTLVERNLLVNNARGIGFGLGSSGHTGGIIRNNMVHTIQDVGIGLESAPDSQVLNNSVYTENYQNSIEYRFSATSGLQIVNNLTNGSITSRDGGSASLLNNITSAQMDWFMDALGGDLHLKSKINSVVDKALVLVSVSDDFDGDLRPIGLAPDIGADEYGDPPPSTVMDLRVAQAITTTGSLTISLVWNPPTDANTQMIRYATTPITPTNWESAEILVGDLTGGASSFSASIPYFDGTLYFAHKSYNPTGGWSQLSNNAYWPHHGVYLPLVLR